MGSTFTKIINTAGVKSIKAAECGGATEPIVTEKEFGKSLGFKRGTLGGVGSIVLYNAERDIGKFYLHKMEFLKEVTTPRRASPVRLHSRSFSLVALVAFIFIFTRPPPVLTTSLLSGNFRRVASNAFHAETVARSWSRPFTTTCTARST